MLVKFETKSNRVKGLCFHPKRSWILAGLHSGLIQLWDYQLQTMLDKYEGHEGPVRSVAFHAHQPIFVSGGDDFKIKVWNYQQRRCVFTLLGHLDYVRSVCFHPHHPWILSASDDQTIRIWNLQSRERIAMLSGHNHYVMHAQFHPSQDIILSASLDQTARVWDITNLCEKTNPSGPPSVNFRKTSSDFTHFSPGSGRSSSDSANSNVDLFSKPDAILRQSLEGHENGVNFASFHPRHPLIATCSDDRQVKLWRIMEGTIFELHSFRGHHNNVSAVFFHPHHPYILSVSEDKSICVWGVIKRTLLQVFRRDKDLFWALAPHPSLNIFAAGHDSGLLIFKLERERPVWTTYAQSVFYVKEGFLRRLHSPTGEDTAMMRLRSQSQVEGEIPPHYHNLSYNPAEHSILLTRLKSATSRMDFFELYKIPTSSDPASSTSAPVSPRDWKKFLGRNAIWVSRNKFAVLTDTGHITIQNSTALHKGGKGSSKSALPICVKDESFPNSPPEPLLCTRIFPAAVGHLLVQETEHISLFALQFQSHKRVAKLRIPKVKQVVWSRDMNYVALLGKATVTLCDRHLNLLSGWMEVTKVKSGAWEESTDKGGTVRVFIYNTSNVLKYGFTNGDNGIIRTLELPLYILRAHQSKIVCLTRSVTCKILTVSPTEYLFKLSLIRQNYDEVLSQVRSSPLVGQATICYLQARGYPELALHFVSDEPTRFSLAIQCLDVDAALQAAKILDSQPHWAKLSELALLVGNHQVAELCYQRCRNHSKLAFLYLVTGQLAKLQKLMKMASLQKMPSSAQYHAALLLGDPRERTRILAEAGGQRTSLAYCTAVFHGISEEAERLRAKLSEEQMDRLKVAVGKAPLPKLLSPPPPFHKMDENWPLLNIARSAFGTGGITTSPLLQHQTTDLEEIPSAGWDDLDEDPLEEKPADTVASGGDWDTETDVDLSSVEHLPKLIPSENEPSLGLLPTKGTPLSQTLANSSSLPVDQVIAGNFEAAAILLQRKFGVTDLSPFRSIFLEIFSKSRLAYTPLPNQPPLPLFPLKERKLERNKSVVSHCPVFTLEELIGEKLRPAYDLVTSGKFSDAVDRYRSLLLRIPFLVLESRTDVSKAQELILLCKEYILGLRIELHRQSLPKGTEEVQKRICELSAYFTHCSLQPVHLILALRTAMNSCFRLGNFHSAALFCRRLLELGPKAEMAMQARKILQVCESKGMQDQVGMEYDGQNPFNLCGQTFQPIYRGREEAECQFCEASYKQEFVGGKCVVCEVGKIAKWKGGVSVAMNLRAN